MDNAAASRRTCVRMSILATAPDGFAAFVVRLFYVVEISEVAGFVGFYQFACRPHRAVVVDREASNMSAGLSCFLRRRGYRKGVSQIGRAVDYLEFLV